MKKLTYLSFFLFFIIGFTLTLAGALIIEIAATFQVDTYVIGYIFSLLPVGCTLAMALSGFLITRFSGKRFTLMAVLSSFMSIVGLGISRDITAFSISMLAFGLSYGALISIGSYLIVHLYDNQLRSSRLNLLNLCYSIGAISAPIIGGLLVQNSFPWQMTYGLSLLFLSVAGWITFTADFTVVQKRMPDPEVASCEKWGLNIYLIGGALFCYGLSEVIIVNWAVVYFRQTIGLELTVATSLLSLFYTFMGIGRLFSNSVIQKITLEKYLLLGSGLVVVTFPLLLFSYSYLPILLTTSLMGLCYSGLYASIIAFGTLQLPHPSSKLVTFYITLASTGGVIGMFSSGYIKQSLGVVPCLSLSAITMAIVFLLIWLTQTRHFTTLCRCFITKI